MRNIIPVSDLQRQTAQILNDVNESSEPVVITQRGRASAVIVSAKRYAEIELQLDAYDDLELERLIALGENDVASGNTMTLDEVRDRMSFTR